jgi:hypothetical protein
MVFNTAILTHVAVEGRPPHQDLLNLLRDCRSIDSLDVGETSP